MGCDVACFGRRGLKPKRAIPHPITIQNMRRPLGRVRKDGRNDIRLKSGDQPFVEDDHIESGGGVGDEVAEHVHLCNKIVFSEKTNKVTTLEADISATFYRLHNMRTCYERDKLTYC